MQLAQVNVTPNPQPFNVASKLPCEVLQIFISSTFHDLAAERNAVHSALAELNMPLATLGVCLLPVDLRTGADVRPPLEVCLQRVASCDLLITLLGFRAGWLAPDGRSITECEFDAAQSHALPCLAYVRDPKTLVLTEDVDRSDSQVKVLNRLRAKVDTTVKRDTFRGPEQLRGHILRDVLSWVLDRPDARHRLASLAAPSALPEVKEYLDAIDSGDLKRAVDIITSTRFERDMRRFGTEWIHRELLRDLLELGSLVKPTRVTDPILRSRMLLEFLVEFPESGFTPAAMHEAQSLEGTLNQPAYSFHVARTEVRLYEQSPATVRSMKRMLRSAWATRDLHVRAQAYHEIALHNEGCGDHRRAHRWFWLSIQTICRMPDMCPHCLASAFIGAARTSRRYDCRCANDRYLKAYLTGRVIPDRSVQLNALLGLSDHLARHDRIEESVACGVVAARLARESLPKEPEYGLQAILADVTAQHGRERVADVLERVEPRADSILEELVDRYKVTDFTQTLDLKPSRHGDHW